MIGLAVSILTAFDGEPTDFSHQVEYSVDIRTNGSLNDTEFLLPYPEDEKFRDAIRDDLTRNVSKVNDFNASTSLTDAGYLKLDIGDFRPETRDERFNREINITPEKDEEIRSVNVSGIREYSSYDFIVKIDYNRTIDTRRGLENEPYLPSNASECREVGDSGCATTRAYVDYDAGNDTYLEMDVSTEGSNLWREGFHGASNSYRQRFYNSFYEEGYLTGSQENWITLEGRKEQGDGVYR